MGEQAEVRRRHSTDEGGAQKTKENGQHRTASAHIPIALHALTECYRRTHTHQSTQTATEKVAHTKEKASKQASAQRRRRRRREEREGMITVMVMRTAIEVHGRPIFEEQGEQRSVKDRKEMGKIKWTR